MSKRLNKNSANVQSIVDFTLDTKPYHSKISEIVVQYAFDEELNVRIRDNTVKRVVTKPTAAFQFFSEGAGFDTVIPLQRVAAPHLLVSGAGFSNELQVGRFVAGRDEATDLALVPFCYSKRSFDGPGTADVVLNRGSTVIPLTESVDFFQSHGSFQFVTRRASNLSTGFFSATYTTGPFPQLVTIDVGTTVGLYIVGPATQVSTTQIQVYGPGTVKVWGLANPSAFTWQEIRDTGRIVELKTTCYTRPFLLEIQQHLNALELGQPPHFNPAAKTHLAAAIATASSATYPSPTGYDLHITQMLAALVAGNTPLLPGFSAWSGAPGNPTAVSTRLSALKQLPAELNEFGDSSLAKSGQAIYSPSYTLTNQLQVSGLTVNEPDEWTIRCVDALAQVWEVVGKRTGSIGFFVFSGGATAVTFTSTRISFTATRLGAAVIGSALKVTPTNNLVVGTGALEETWNLIQVNPISHTRSRFFSTRYGFIEDAEANFGQVTVTSGAVPSGTVILRARAGGLLFDISHASVPSYTGVAMVGSLYSSGGLAFKLRSGSQFGFQAGDTFFIEVENSPASHRNLDLYYGYDFDPYDADELVYENIDALSPLFNVPLHFTYDSRFVDYNLSAFNLQVTEAAEDGVHYRLVAQPDLTRPIATLKKDGSGPFEWVDLAAVNDAGPILPDPSHIPVSSMSGSPAPDIKLYFAENFLLERSLNGSTWLEVGTVDIGETFSDPVLGISFTLVEGSKPFIAAVCEAEDASTVAGGDVFYWQIDNPLPTAEVIGVVSGRLPRAILRSDGFFDAPAADWQLTFTSATNWQLAATFNSGLQAGQPVPGYPVTGRTNLAAAGANEGLSFRNSQVHFTLVPGAGFGAGDQFTWSTFESKPMLLVHGSASGWQPPADYGEWYWNGKIGFRVGLPVARTFVPSLAGSPAAGAPLPQVAVTRLRKDCPSLTYTFERVDTGNWRVRRSDRGIVGFAPPLGSFSDTYIQVVINADPGANFNVNVDAADFAFAHGHSLVVVKSRIGALNPLDDDVLTVTIDHQASIALTVNYDAVVSPPSVIPDQADLDPLNIDPRFVSTDTGNPNFPLQLHSPEAVTLQDFVPLTLRLLDSSTSQAHFSDAARRIELISTGTGQRIATAFTQSTSDINAGWRLQWDQAFYDTYLPLATSCNIFIYGTGLNEKVKVNLFETATFLLGGNEAAGALFSEPVTTVSVDDEHFITIDVAHSESVDAAVEDSPFVSFLPGYDNLPYDAENALGLDLASLEAASGQYDTSETLVSSYLRAQYFALIALPSGDEQAEYEGLLRLIAPYLNPVGTLDANTALPALEAALGSTSLPELISNIGGPTVEPEFGVPSRGMAMSIEARQDTTVAQPSFAESLTAFSMDADGAMDTNPFDATPFDTIPYTVAILSTEYAELPIVPAATWEDFGTPLSSGSFEATAVEVFLTGAPPAPPAPTFYAWVEGEPSAWLITEVLQLANGRYRFNLPFAAKVKVGVI